ncbi:hypothetical protein EMCRGX_G020796 [Ephydatia muelleri]
MESRYAVDRHRGMLPDAGGANVSVRFVRALSIQQGGGGAVYLIPTTRSGPCSSWCGSLSRWLCSTSVGAFIALMASCLSCSTLCWRKRDRNANSYAT